MKLNIKSFTFPPTHRRDVMSVGRLAQSVSVGHDECANNTNLNSHPESQKWGKTADGLAEASDESEIKTRGEVKKKRLIKYPDTLFSTHSPHLLSLVVSSPLPWVCTKAIRILWKVYLNPFFLSIVSFRPCVVTARCHLILLFSLAVYGAELLVPQQKAESFLHISINQSVCFLFAGDKFLRYPSPKWFMSS